MPIPDNQPDEAGARPIALEDAPKSHLVFSRLKRELSDEELSSPGVQKLLLDYLAQAEAEIATLKSFREMFHSADKRNGVLEEKLKVNTSAEVVSTGTIAIGGVILGYATQLTSTPYGGWLALGCGGLLIGVGIVAKAKVIRK